MRDKRLLTALVLASLLLVSSCKLRPGSLWEVPSTPQDSFDLVEHPWDGDFSFLVLSDMHIGREGCLVPGPETLKPWIDALEPAFILNLGDAVDKGRPEEFREARRYFKALDLGEETEVYALLGNHEVKEDFAASWAECWNGQPYHQAFKWGDVSFYLANNALRTLGRKQLAELEAALAADPNPRKILVCHVPLHSPDAYAYFNMPDAKEVNRILDACLASGVDLILSGHCHRDSGFSYSPSLSEKTVGSYNGSPSAFETPPMFYSFSYFKEAGKLEMDTYVFDERKGVWAPEGEPQVYPLR